MDITIWIDGEETLRTRNVAEARKAYRAAVVKHVNPVKEYLTAALAAFDHGAKTLGVFETTCGPVEAMFHR